MTSQDSRPTISEVAKRYVLAGLVFGVLVFFIWWLLAMLNVWRSFTNVLGLMAVTGGGAACTRWINEAWLRYVSTHRVRCPVVFLVPLYVVAPILIFFGFIAAVGAVLQPGQMGSVFLQSQIKADAEREADRLRGEFDRQKLDYAERHRRFNEAKAEIAERVLRPYLPQLTALNGVCGAVGLWVLYAGLLGLNIAVRSKHEALFRAAKPEDVRGQALYFRSFTDDAKPGIREGLFASFSLRTEEELLAASFVGASMEFFALGRPGEPMPGLGARRLYFTHEEWKDNVAAMLPEARIVVLQPGETPSVMWEAEQIVSMVRPERFAIWIPPELSVPSHPTMTRFADAVSGQFPHGVIPATKSAWASFSASDFIVFDENWVPEWASSFLKEKDRKQEKRRYQDALLVRVLKALASGRLQRA